MTRLVCVHCYEEVDAVEAAAVGGVTLCPECREDVGRDYEHPETQADRDGALLELVRRVRRDIYAELRR